MQDSGKVGLHIAQQGDCRTFAHITQHKRYGKEAEMVRRLGWSRAWGL